MNALKQLRERTYMQNTSIALVLANIDNKQFKFIGDDHGNS